MEEIKNTETVAEEMATEKVAESVPEEIKEKAPKKTFKDFMADVETKLTRKTVGGLIGQILLIFIVIPEAFLMICGLIFDKWLKLYQLTTVIFIVWAIILIIAIYLSVKSIIWYNKNKKNA